MILISNYFQTFFQPHSFSQAPNLHVQTLAKYIHLDTLYILQAQTELILSPLTTCTSTANPRLHKGNMIRPLRHSNRSNQRSSTPSSLTLTSSYQVLSPHLKCTFMLSLFSPHCHCLNGWRSPNQPSPEPQGPSWSPKHPMSLPSGILPPQDYQENL